MKRISKLVLNLLAISCIAATTISCGSAGNNDQGVAFTLFGFFGSSPTDACGETPAMISNGELLLFSDSETITPARQFLGLQNNLSGQFIRTQRAFINYEIPGASIQPPNTNVPISRIIEPFVDPAGTGGFDSSLPDSFASEETGCNRTFVGTNVYTPEILTWISLNRSSLPEAPFTVIATVTVSGVSSSGALLDSNNLEFAVTALDSVVITEGTGGTGDSGTDDETEEVA
ncbi:MAG: hypothetical protein R3A13_08705 [Bdellovibrionota bacterium]